jgi:hypothetical protein
MRYVQREWAREASHTFKRPTGTYIRGIEAGAIYPYGDPMTAAVINQVPHAATIEWGMKPKDLKENIQRSHKARDAKELKRMLGPLSGGPKGGKFLIIPFRHGTPGAKTLPPMPRSVYDKAKELTTTRRAGSWLERSQNLVSDKPAQATIGGQPAVRRFGYAWGSKLSKKDVSFKVPGEKKPGYLGIRGKLNKPLGFPNYEWKTSPYAGMYKFQRPGGGDTHYMTFRTMASWASGWIHPGIAPKHIAKKTADRTTGTVVKLVSAGIKEDMRRIKQQVMGRL